MVVRGLVRATVAASALVVTTCVVGVHPGRAATSPVLQWAKNDGSVAADDAVGTALDSTGNVYVAGWTTGSFSGFTNAGSSDGYLAKYASNGIRLWLVQFGSTGADYPVAVAVDVAGNTYVLGHTYGNLDGSTAQTAGDLFLIKFSAAGRELWRRQFGSAQRDQAGGIALDRAANVFVVGSTEGSMGTGTNAGPNDSADVVVAKFSSGGTRSWLTQFGTSGDDFGYGVAVDLWGTVAVVGETTGQFAGMVRTGLSDAFIATFAPDGARRWLRQENSGPSDVYNNFTSVVMDDLENIIVAGKTGGSYNADTAVGGESDAVVVKYNKLSSRLWVRQFGTPAADSLLSIVRAPNGDLFVAGDTRGILYGYKGARGGSDALVASLSASGALTWWQQFGTANEDRFVAVAANVRGNVVAVGYTNGALVSGLVTRGEDAVMFNWSAFPAVVAPSSVVQVGGNVGRTGLLSLAGLTAPIGSTVVVAVSSTSRARCVVANSSIRGVRRGSCAVVVTVRNQSGIVRSGKVALNVR